MRIKHALIAAACVTLYASAADAYPTSVIFAPTGDAKAGGDVGTLFYSSMVFTQPGVSGVAPGLSWFGADFGVLPKIPYGNSGVSFGGLEIGFDAIVSDLVTISATSGKPLSAAQSFVKPVFNAKLQLITETKFIPHVAFGVMELDPFKAHYTDDCLDPATMMTKPCPKTTWRSMNMLYGALTKTIEVNGTSYGRVTLGLSGMASKFDKSLFYSTGPFKEQAQLAILGGYESPAFGPVSFAIDYIGGVSEVSSANVAFSLTPIDGATWALGGWFGNDYKNFAGGAFTYVYVSWNILKLFGHKDAPPATPAATPAAPADPAAPGSPSAPPAAAPPSSAAPASPSAPPPAASAAPGAPASAAPPAPAAPQPPAAPPKP